MHSTYHQELMQRIMNHTPTARAISAVHRGLFVSKNGSPFQAVTAQAESTVGKAAAVRAAELRNDYLDLISL